MKAISLLTMLLCSQAILRAEEPPRTAKPTLVEQIQDGQRRRKCIQNTKNLAVALIMYSVEHDGRLPGKLDMVLGKEAIIKPEELACPFDPKKAPLGYELLLPDRLVSEVKDPDKTPMLRAKFAGPDGKRSVAFLDGHVEEVADSK